MMSNTFTYDEKTKWKILSFSLIGILVLSTTSAALFFQIPQQLLNGLVTSQQGVNAPSLLNAAYGAGVLTNVFALPADNLFSTKTYYTIAFTTATAGSINTIEMTFPAGFNVASAKLLEVQGIGAGSLSVSGQTVKYTISSAVSVPAQRAIKISLADITNSATTSNQIAISTKAISGPNIVILDGPTNSAIFTLIQVSNAMITNGAVSNTKIGSDAVDSSKIKNGQVTISDLANNSVNSSKVNDGSINAIDLAANSVDSSKIVDGSVGNQDLAPNAVGTNNIADRSIAGADVSQSFIKKVHRTDANTGDWNPDGITSNFEIHDINLNRFSVILLSVQTSNGFMIDCRYAHVDYTTDPIPYFMLGCSGRPDDGAILDYVIIN